MARRVLSSIKYWQREDNEIYTFQYKFGENLFDIYKFRLQQKKILYVINNNINKISLTGDFPSTLDNILMQRHKKMCFTQLNITLHNFGIA